MSSLLYKQLTDLPLQTTERSFTGIGSAKGKFIGVWRPCVMRLTPKVEVVHKVLISPDEWPYYILGNNLSDREKVEKIS